MANSFILRELNIIGVIPSTSYSNQKAHLYIEKYYRNKVSFSQSPQKIKNKILFIITHLIRYFFESLKLSLLFFRMY